MLQTLHSALLPAVLDASVLASLDILVLNRPKRIQLPTSDTHPAAREVIEDDTNDPFDIATSGEVSDGSPIDEDGFWAKVRGKKMMQTLVLAIGLAVACGRSGWSFWIDFEENNIASIISPISMVAFQRIRKEFANSTIITVAHRLWAIIDYEKVIVLDQGRIAEYDEPSKLLADPTSKFYALCKSASPQEFSALKKMADGASQGRLALAEN